MTLLLEAWAYAMRRWCRRYAHIGLGEVVRRRGHLLSTRTHLDVLFDHTEADVRIRKAGLDLDPGWVAWFGRIVLFHYHYGEQADGDR